MNESVDKAMNRVITAMYERVGDEITVDDLARTAMYSKFHFSRMFRQATGVSPGRFLSALRFQEAKRLLAATSLSVAEISNRVGYSSLGTFSTRFKKFVGVTPTEYRRGGRWRVARVTEPGGPSMSIRGRIRAAVADDCGQTFVGLFPDPVPQGAPVRSTVLPCPGDYRLDDVPEGTWYLLAQGVLLNRAATGGDLAAGPTGAVGRLGPITIRAGNGAGFGVADLELRPMRTVDLPVLPAPFTTRPEAVGPLDAMAGFGARRFGQWGRSVQAPPLRAT